MDSLAAYRFAFTSPSTHIFHCLSAFFTYLFSLGTDEAKLHHIKLYATILLEELSKITEAYPQQRAMINNAIQELFATARSIKKDMESRSRQFVCSANQEFAMVFYSALSKRFETSLCTFRININPQMQIHCRGSNNVQHNMPYGNQIPESVGRSEIFLRPLGLDSQENPLLFNIKDITIVQGTTNDNYDRRARQSMAPQRNIQAPKGIVWNKDLQNKFKNAVHMLGGHNSATATKIWRVLKDENVTVRQVQSYLQRYRKKQRNMG